MPATLKEAELQTSNGITTTSVSKADVLNNTLMSVFTKEDLSVLPSVPDLFYQSIQEIDVSELGVFSLLSQLD